MPVGAGEQDLRTVFAAAGVSGSWDWDIVGKKLYVDEHFARLYGLDPHVVDQGLATSTFFKAIHPEDQARIRIAVAGLVAGAERFSKEFRVIAPDGATLWMHGRGQGHYNSNDEPVRFSGLLVDVTERKRAEERLRIAQSAGGVGTFEYSDGFATVSVSGEFCRLLGFHPADRLPVRTINAAMCPGEQQLIPESTAEAALHPLAASFRIRRNDTGEERWIARRGELLPDSRGSGYRLLGVIYDVTEAKQLESELRALNETLEQRVAAAVDERRLAEEALRQAQKMEAVGQLTGGIAHDFNNLLTVIIGSIDSAMRRVDAGSDPRLARSLAHAMNGAERAATLTHRLLAFSRRQPLAPRAVDVPRILSGMSDLLGRTIPEAISIAIDAPDTVWTVEADPHQLENAIINLAVNARDAMPGGGKLTVSAQNHGPESQSADLGQGDYVGISVSDTGIGMDESTLARVFDPFFTTKEVGKGTGLGLSMVYGFAKQSGGDVRLISEPGIGTTVTILLPRAVGMAESETQARDDQVVGGNLSETILVVEDDDDVRAFTVSALREIGYRVIEAHDGVTALHLLQKQEQPVGLLVTDVVMPNMSGSELADAARIVQPDIAVLFTSGYTREMIMHEGRLDAGVDLLPKPFTLKTLAARVRDLLDRYHGDGAAELQPTAGAEPGATERVDPAVQPL